MTMRMVSGWSTERDPAAAAHAALRQVEQGLAAPPDLLFCHATARHAGAGLPGKLRSYSGPVPLIGGTSCRGVATEAGFHAEDGRALGLLGLRDAAGAFGVGLAEQGAAPEAAAEAALLDALAQAGRPGEVPDLLWLALAPGREERVLARLQAIVGTSVPIFGGSTADDDLSGGWRQFGNEDEAADSVAVAALFPSAGVSPSCHSGYQPSSRSGCVTSAAGRIVRAIDDRPAATVYDEWTGGAISEVIAAGGGNVLALSTLHPLAREGGEMAGSPVHILVHPERVEPDGGLALFAEVAQGERLVLMRSTQDQLVEGAGLAAASARRLGADTEPVGAMTVCCAGCMLAVSDRMDEVVDRIRTALGGRPFLTTFTFGEQGRSLAAGNYHGNLMISAACFGTCNRE